jgi:hypothetical protein
VGEYLSGGELEGVIVNLKPIRRSDIIAQDMGDETLLYSAKDRIIHILNPTARRIWELCDGAHTVEDMAKALRASFSIAPEREVLGDIQRTLEVLAEKELLQDG